MIADDFIQWLENKGFGTVGTNLFDNFQPLDPDNCVTAYDVDAPQIDESSSLKIDQLGLQVITRNASKAQAKTIAYNIHKAFIGFGGESLVSGGNIISSTYVDQPPRNIGKDEKNRTEYSVVYNYRLQSTGDTYRL
jgi:hypothetical protein